MRGRISCPELIGRVEESRLLADALERARAGEAETVFVGGEAGIGKSRLLREFAANARAAGAEVLVGGCAPLGQSPPPLLPFVEALRSTIRAAGDERQGALRARLPELGRLVPELTREGSPPAPVDDAGGSQERVFELLLAAFELLSKGRPLLLVLEDLHWSDRSTLQLLALRIHTRRIPRCLLVATFRSDELTPGDPLRLLLAECERSGNSDRIELRRFGRRELVAQLSGILGRLPEHRLIEEIVARSEGNPFFAEELLAAESGRPERLSTLRDLLLARVETLPESAREAVRVLAAARRPLSHDAFAAVCGTSGDELDHALRRAVDRHVVVVAGDGGYTFRHALMREAVYADLLPGERVRLHAALGRALEEQRTHARVEDARMLADLAHHWSCAGDLQRAFAAAVDAGRAAEEIHAHAETLAQYEHALALWDETNGAVVAAEVDRAQLRARAAEAAANFGEPERAVALAEVAVAELDAREDPVTAALLYERLGRYCWIAGHSAGAVDAFGEAVALMPASPPRAERARVLAALAHLQWVLNEFGGARRRAQEALEVARRAGAELEEARALTVLGATDTDPAAGVVEIRTARAQLERVAAPPDLVFITYVYETMVLDAIGQPEFAYDAARGGIDYCRRHGVRRAQGTWLQAIAANALIKVGRWDEADAVLEAAVLDGPGGISRRAVLVARAELELARGNLAAARDSTADARDAADDGGPLMTRIYELQAAVALAEHDYERGRADVADGLRRGGSPTDLARLCRGGLELEASRAEVARAARRADEAARAVAEAAALLVRARRLAADGPAGAEAAAWLLTCEAELTRAESVPTPEAWEKAAAAWNGRKMPYPRAYCELRAAEALLARRGAKRRVAGLLRTASATASALGAAPLAAAIASLARRARIDLEAEASTTRSTRAKRRKQTHGLTARELDVLRLVARGYTNPQIAGTLFISPKTAGAHV